MSWVVSAGEEVVMILSVEIIIRPSYCKSDERFKDEGKDQHQAGERIEESHGVVCLGSVSAEFNTDEGVQLTLRQQIPRDDRSSLVKIDGREGVYR